jgi:hypothetical protein
MDSTTSFINCMIFYAIVSSMYRSLRTFSAPQLMSMYMWLYVVLLAIALGIALYACFQLGGLEREVEILRRNVEVIRKKELKLHNKVEMNVATLGYRVEKLEFDTDAILGMVYPLPEDNEEEFPQEEAAEPAAEECGEGHCCGESAPVDAASEAPATSSETSLNIEATVSST